MGDNPDIAVELAERIWPEVDPETFPMSWDEMRDYLEGLDTMAVFFAGYYSNPNVDYSDNHFVIDGNGHFRSLSDRNYEQACVDYMRNDGYESIVIEKKYPAPMELAEVLALWGKTVRTANRRPSAKCEGGCTGCGKCGKLSSGKAPSKNRKTVGRSRNARSAETRSSDTRSRSTKAKSKAGRRRDADRHGLLPSREKDGSHVHRRHGDKGVDGIQFG